jgi:Mrp family chromosome partitioning ATPase
VIAVFLVLGVAAVALYLLTRDQALPPTRYRTSIAIAVPGVAPEDDSRRNADNPLDGVQQLLLGKRVAAARDPAVLAAALEQSGLSDDDKRGAELSAASNSDGTLITLTALTRTPEASDVLADAYADAYIASRRDDNLKGIQEQLNSEFNSLDRLQAERDRVDADIREALGELPPVATGGEGETPATGGGGGTQGTRPLEVPRNATLQQQILVLQRNALSAAMETAANTIATLRVEGAVPKSFADIINNGDPAKITKQLSSPLLPAAGIGLGALLLGFMAAVARDRFDRTIRSERSAALAFEAPVLSIIPRGRRRAPEFSVFDDPFSARCEAYRSLAARSVATDRLPRAIFVSSPRGDAYEEVAANFAAALADLGISVALIGTLPEQQWYLKPFDVAEDELTSLPELLHQSQRGVLNGQLRQRLAFTPLSPRLMLVPPGAEAELGLLLDGLPPLLESLANDGVEVTVIAGPPVLENSNSTLVGWATRSVLWVAAAGDLTSDEASSATAQLELAGASAFGVALISEEE